MFKFYHKKKKESIKNQISKPLLNIYHFYMFDLIHIYIFRIMITDSYICHIVTCKKIKIKEDEKIIFYFLFKKKNNVWIFNQKLIKFFLPLNLYINNLFLIIIIITKSTYKNTSIIIIIIIIIKYSVLFPSIPLKSQHCKQ